MHMYTTHPITDQTDQSRSTNAISAFQEYVCIGGEDRPLVEEACVPSGQSDRKLPLAPKEYHIIMVYRRHMIRYLYPPTNTVPLIGPRIAGISIKGDRDITSRRLSSLITYYFFFFTIYRLQLL